MTATRILPLADWCDTPHIAACLRQCSPEGDGRWGQVEIVAQPPWDYLAVFNAPQMELPDSSLARAVVFQCETPTRRATWAEFYARCATKAFYLFDIERHHCVDKWYVNMPWEQLQVSPAKKLPLSGCVSAQRYLPLHRARTGAVAELAKQPGYHHFGRGSWGHLPAGVFRGAPGEKREALDPYLVHFNCENDREK